MRNFKTAALIALSLGVSACSTSNRGLESVHQPVVTRTDYVLDVDASSGLSSSEARRVEGWLEALRVGYGDHVALDLPDGGAGSLTREMVSALAAKHGLLVDDVAPVTTGAIAPGSARIVVSRVKASVPNCPDWSGKLDPNFNNNGGSNFGCAVNTNFAAMIANPADLVRGADDVSSDVTTSSNAIRNYRSGKSKELKTESAGGK
jgi:pilus assembly protein CpaD